MKLTKSYIKNLISEVLSEMSSVDTTEILPGSEAEKAALALTAQEYNINSEQAKEVKAARDKFLALKKTGTKLSPEDTAAVLKMQGVSPESEAIKTSAKSRKAQADRRQRTPDGEFADVLNRLSSDEEI